MSTTRYVPDILKRDEPFKITGAPDVLSDRNVMGLSAEPFPLSIITWLVHVIDVDISRVSPGTAVSIALAISAALVTGNIFPVGGAGVGLPVVGYYDFVAKKTEKHQKPKKV